jgi:hypothetical protein
MQQLFRDFYFSYGDLNGSAAPTATGLLMHLEEDDTAAAIALAAEIGNVVVSLPLADDPKAGYEVAS